MERNPAAWIGAARQYFSDVRTEFRKITWPSQQEYVATTIGVVVVVVLLTIALGVIDLVLGQAMQLLVR